MDLDLSPEHALLRDTVRDFMLTEVAPVIERARTRTPLPDRDRPAHRRARLARHPDPRGRGRGRPRHARLRDRGRGDRPGVGLARAHRRGPHQPRMRPAASGRHRRTEPALPRPDGSGTVIGAYGLTEPGAGSDAGGTRTTARRDGEDWVLDGSKRFITNAGQAGTYVITARTGTHRQGRRRDQRVHRPRRHAGIQRRPARGQARAPRLGDRRAARSRTPASRPRTCSAQQGDGFRTFLKILDGGRISIGALAVGPGAGRARCQHPVCPDARAVRPADRLVPGRRVHGRRHGDRDRSRPGAGLEGGLAQGPGPRLRPRRRARPSCSRRRSARGRRTTRSRSTAAMAT